MTDMRARAIIEAVDKTGNTFDKIAAKMKAVDQAAKAMKTAVAAGKIGAEVDRATRAMAKLGKTDAFRDQHASFIGARTTYRRVQQDVQRLAREMKAAEKPTAALAREFAKAKVAVKDAAAAYAEKAQAVKLAKREMEAAGVPTRALSRQEDALRNTLLNSNRALGRQTIEVGKNKVALRERLATQQRVDRHADRHADRQAGRHHGFVAEATGAAAGAAGVHSVVGGIKKAAKDGANYQHERVALENAGRTHHEIDEIEHVSRETTKQLPTATYSENLKVINETTGAFGSLHHAIENLPFMQKTASVLHAAAGDKIHEGAGELGNKLARFFEERQVAGDTPTFQREAEGLVRAMAFTRGNFNPSEAMNFAQQAKSSLPNYSERFLTRIAPSLVTMLGGHRAGTAANAFTSVVTGKVNDKKQAEEWLRYGLLDPKQTTTKGGHAVGWRAGAVKDTNLALSDPLKWMEEVALPAMKAKGVKVDDRLELTKALATMFRNQNANVFANDLAQPASRTRLHKDEEMIGRAGTLDEIYQRNLREDPKIALTGVTAGLDNLLTVAASPMMAKAAAGLTTLSGALNKVADYGAEHPTAALAVGGAAAAGGLAASGAVTASLINNGIGGTLAIGGNAVGAGVGAAARATPTMAAGYGVYVLADAFKTAIGAALDNWQPKGAENIAGLRRQLDEVETKRSDIQSRLHPSRRGEPNADLDRLSGEAGDLRNRIRSGEERMRKISEAMGTRGSSAPTTVGTAAAGFGLNGPQFAAAGPVPSAPLSGTVPHRLPPPRPEGIGASGKIEATVKPDQITAKVTEPVDVTGKVEAEITGAAQVAVTVKVEGGGQVTNMSASSSGNVRASVGTSMPHIKAGPR